MVLIIDNYDSFTYNLYQQIGRLGWPVIVKEHDRISVDDIRELNPSHIVISPGPKDPASSGICIDVIREFYESIPILGVCLGQQCIGEVFGSKTIPANSVIHGKTNTMGHSQKGLFKSLESPIKVAQYNSLVIDAVPQDFEISGWLDDGTIMAIQHKSLPVYGVQFHPESFMTEQGDVVMENFLRCNE